MDSPLISVIIPVYKVEQYIRKCVDSVIEQTYDNLEIFLVDDGSPDKCGEICDEYARKDKRIIVIHKENGGLSDARNVALDVATGDYVMFVDSDDWIKKETCDFLIRTIQKQSVDIVCFGLAEILPSGKIAKYIKAEHSRFLTKSEAIRLLVSYGGGVGNYAWNKIYSRHLFEDVRYPKGKIYEDNGTTYKLFHKANAIYVIDKVCYNYQLRSTSISAIWYKPTAIQARLEMWKGRLEFFKTNYPEHVDIQVAQILGEMFIGMVIMKGEPEYDAFKKDVDDFITQNKPDLKKLKIYNRRIWLYYYSPILFNFYVKFILKRQ